MEKIANMLRIGVMRCYGTSCHNNRLHLDAYPVVSVAPPLQWLNIMWKIRKPTQISTNIIQNRSLITYSGTRTFENQLLNTTEAGSRSTLLRKIDWTSPSTGTDGKKKVQ